MLASHPPVLPTRSRRRVPRTFAGKMRNAVAVFRVLRLLEDFPSTALALDHQDRMDLAEEIAQDIADVFKELMVNVAARDARGLATVAASYDQSANCGAPPSFPFQPPASHPESLSSTSTEDSERLRDVPSSIASLAIYPVDEDVSKENITRFQVDGLRRLNGVIPCADQPDFLFVHYALISSKPVAYVRVLPRLPKDAFGCVDPDVLQSGPGLCPRVAHLHISDEEQATRPLVSPERTAVLSLVSGEQREVLKSRVIAKVPKRTCVGHKFMRTSTRDIVERRLAARRPLPAHDPMFYGMYLPHELLLRDMHTKCGPGIADCVEMPPIVLVEDVEPPAGETPAWQIALSRSLAHIRAQHERSRIIGDEDLVSG